MHKDILLCAGQREERYHQQVVETNLGTASTQRINWTTPVACLCMCPLTHKDDEGDDASITPSAFVAQYLIIYTLEAHHFMSKQVAHVTSVRRFVVM